MQQSVARFSYVIRLKISDGFRIGAVKNTMNAGPFMPIAKAHRRRP